MKALCSLCLCLLVAACAGTDDLRGIALKPPLDRAVLISGGAFFRSPVDLEGTFVAGKGGAPAQQPVAAAEAIPFAQIVDVLTRARVFQRIGVDSDPGHRLGLRGQLAQREAKPELAGFLQQARADGYDLLVLIEELHDGPIETLGTNNRWPVTFTTWVLLGVGALIPDRTFESRATLRVSLRELQTGREMLSLSIGPGPVELALTERTDWLGLLLSVIVPPFWVGDEHDAVVASVRATTERRLLLRLARELKSEVSRRNVSEREAASIQLVNSPEGLRVVINSIESVSGARIDGPGYGDEDVVLQFSRDLVGSRRIENNRFLYNALLPPATQPGTFQIKVATLRGGMSSSTFSPDSAR